MSSNSPLSQKRIPLNLRWKDIKEYKGLYKISDSGDVYSSFSKKILIGGFHGAGYRKVNLSKNGRLKTITIYRLVAASFIPNPENKRCVNHKDGNKLNDHFSNLEWVTYQENTIHAYKIGLMKPSVGKFGIDHKSSKKVDQFTLDGRFIKRWDAQKDIERVLGVDASAISKVCRGINSSCCGFTYKFAV